MTNPTLDYGYDNRVDLCYKFYLRLDQIKMFCLILDRSKIGKSETGLGRHLYSLIKLFSDLSLKNLLCFEECQIDNLSNGV